MIVWYGLSQREWIDFQRERRDPKWRLRFEQMVDDDQIKGYFGQWQNHKFFFIRQKIRS